LHITEIASEVLLLVTERRNLFNYKRNDSIYNPNKGCDSKEFLVAIKDIFQYHLKAVEILKGGPKIQTWIF